MEKQIKKQALIFVLIFLVSITLGGCKKDKTPPTVAEQAVTVETTEAKRQDVELNTILSGKLEPIEETEVSSKLSGKVIKVHVKVGDSVQAGDVLFELDSQDLQNAVKQAEAAYRVAEANLKMTQENIENAKVNLERMRALYEEGAVSKQQLEQYELQASETKLEAVRAQVEQARVAISVAESQLRDVVVTAPISGVVTSVNIHVGELATPGVKAVGIANLSKVVIETNVSEYLINKVHKGDKVEVLIKSAQETPFEGNITSLSPAPSGGSMTYPIKVEMENPDLILKPGMFAEIKIVSDKKENVIAIPSESVIMKNGNPVVAVVNGDTAKLVEVQVGMDNGELVEITEGLKEGDIVIVKGQEYVEDGSKIKIKAKK
ncbi:MAG TPA: efflux RND transporter periplasmic adaptor subunit [Clostridiales bacterium]|nr:efflux RND transporter periplasmic adaptor subunit [Clostridiales bacterium]